jgi:hypothetical protein
MERLHHCIVTNYGPLLHAERATWPGEAGPWIPALSRWSATLGKDRQYVLQELWDSLIPYAQRNVLREALQAYLDQEGI